MEVAHVALAGPQRPCTSAQESRIKSATNATGQTSSLGPINLDCLTLQFL